MSEKYHIGQKVRVICKESTVFNEIFTIQLQRRLLKVFTGSAVEMVLAYELNGRGADGFLLAFEEHELEPVYDGDEASSWENCEWKPIGYGWIIKEKS